MFKGNYCYTKCNYKLLSRIRKERLKIGLEIGDYNESLNLSPLLNKKIKNNLTNEIAQVCAVSKKWYNGWFMVLRIKYLSSGVKSNIYWLNYSCWDNIIKNKIENDSTNFSIIS